MKVSGGCEGGKGGGGGMFIVAGEIHGPWPFKWQPENLIVVKDND